MSQMSQVNIHKLPRELYGGNIVTNVTQNNSS